jgi:hypothetical protein
MASQTERQHLRWIAITRFTMVDRNRPLSTLQRRTPWHAATVVIPPQYFLTMPAVILLVLALQRVAGRAEATCEDLVVPAGTTDCDLDHFLQSAIPSF